MFKIGDKVVCVEHFKGIYLKTGIKCPGENPVKGRIYTFDGFSTHPEGIYLEELNYINNMGFRVSFISYKFRKLSDIWSEQILEEIIEQVKEEELILEN